MDTAILERHFQAIGARLKMVDVPATNPRQNDHYSIDVQQGPLGEHFVIVRANQAPDLSVLQMQPAERHLLLHATDGHRFLCGHDERHWFVAGIAARVSTVQAAKRSLLPVGLERSMGTLRTGDLNRRHNRVFKRQGEWFFVPVNRDIPADMILRNEPIQRNARSKPHLCDELYRVRGERVYLVGQQVFSERQYELRARQNPNFARQPASLRVRTTEVYAHGAVRHPDHAKLVLHGWHRVYLNAEQLSEPMAFID